MPTMELLLWRHAEAEDATFDLDDQKRRLTKKGEHQAAGMAKWLRAHGPKEPRILVSPAVRTQQTARAMGLTFETVDSLAPGASVADVLAACSWKNAAAGTRQAVIVIGHQPYLGRVAASLVCGREADWAVKKGAIWWLTHRMRTGHGETLIRCVMPAELT